MDILIKILQVLLSLSLLVILHEGGHFMFAKLFKTRVEKFYLFFDTKFHLFSTYDNWYRRLRGKAAAKKRTDGSGEYEYEGTEYGIGWIPLGGYVKIAGMIDESMDTETLKQDPKPYEYRTKPAWQRLFIVLGGVIMNFFVAFVIYAMVIYHWGQSYIASEDLTFGMKFNEQAKSDGFRDGDIILGVDDKTFDSWQMANLRDLSNGSVAHVLRAGKTLDISLPEKQNLLEMLEAPRYAEERLPLAVDSVLPGSAADQLGMKKGAVITVINGDTLHDFNELQLSLSALRQRFTPEMTYADSLRMRTVSVTYKLTATSAAQTDTVVLSPECTLGFVNRMPDYKVTTRSYSLLASIPAGFSYGVETLGGYVNDLKYVFTKKGAQSVGGFIAIGNIFPAQWNWYQFWMLTALLSIMLGVVNVLPIPALDGGHALFLIYEMVTRRKPSDKFLIRAQYVGMFLLIALLIFANLNDILRLIGIL